VSQADTMTPADRYQELFVDVQMSRVFEDSKTFVDCVPRRHPEQILEEYRSRCTGPDFDISAFVRENFEQEEVPPNCFVSDPNRTLREHIEHLWAVLTRHPREHPERSSLLPLPYDYVVPGGRFSELYYWDSYFTMLGLHSSGCPQCGDLLGAMANNFAYLIDTYGHIPNGNRTYYLSRSQPPVFALMVELFQDTGVRPAVDYLPQLHKEYAFWMDGARDLRPGEAHRRCVKMPDGALLNRYWDDRDLPREESYAEDVFTARRSDRPVHDVYRDLRAGAESGWDFSSRWQDDPADLSTIRTTGILPVDLNSLLFKLEAEIARLSSTKGDSRVAEEFRDRASRRREAIDRYLWNEEEGAYFDYDWHNKHRRRNLTAATTTPLFVNAASAHQAQRVADTVQNRLLAPGGVSTTEVSNSRQQWDRPNGWAPLQWMTLRGLSDYGYTDLANEISRRWLLIVSELYELESKLVEKYVLRPTSEHATGGEYPLQDGFGWTNGVVAKMLQEHPEDEANRCRAGHPTRHCRE
jgi:alpha,alpha-trehalase